MLVLREVCYAEPEDARLWTLYAVSCLRAGRRDEALSALRQALWLRRSEQHTGKARVTSGLLAAVLAGNDTLRLAAA
ncbi:MAG: hypothetical protein IPI67_18630 [Myxococcales bacterium]|nr:hypothetical protein [Myxococcales bacterium]